VALNPKFAPGLSPNVANFEFATPDRADFWPVRHGGKMPDTHAFQRLYRAQNVTAMSLCSRHARADYIEQLSASAVT